MELKRLFVFISLLLMSACDPGNPRPNPTPTPSESGTFTLSAMVSSPPNRIIDGPLPGCADAVELINQSFSTPETQVTFDQGGIIDRVGTVIASATYNYSVRPINPLNCQSTTLPSIPGPTVTLGFNYLADVTRREAICMNASTIEFSQFEVTGTPLDKLIEDQIKENVWQTVDTIMATRLQPLFGTGTRQANSPVRCSNWVDLSTL